jgi:hypothetical protein
MTCPNDEYVYMFVYIYRERDSRGWWGCDFGKKNAALLLCCVLCTL